MVQDPDGALGPYAYKGKQWVSFNDVDMIRCKSELVNSMGLGGAMIWALDLDDFRNRCGCEAYPLLKTINRVLRNYPATSKQCEVKGQVNHFGSIESGRINTFVFLFVVCVAQLRRPFRRLACRRAIAKRMPSKRTKSIVPATITASLDRGTCTRALPD